MAVIYRRKIRILGFDWPVVEELGIGNRNKEV